jgi:ribosome-associated translation inhibitor RaiA
MASQLMGYWAEVTLNGRLPVRAKDYAMAKIGALVRYAPMPVVTARVKLSLLRHRGSGEQVVAEVNLDVNGRLVRVQVAVDSSDEAIDLAQDRLRRKLSQLGSRLVRMAGSGRTGRGFAVRPPVEREVYRRPRAWTRPCSTWS